MVVASTGAQNVAYASSRGAIFSDYLLEALGQGQSLYGGFQSARWAVQAPYPDQTPWLDDNGNGIPNEASDGQEAQRRGFNYRGTLAGDPWPPYIAQVVGPAIIQAGQGAIRANVLDNESVRRVWIEVYSPSYRLPQPGEELVSPTLPGAVLQDQGGGWYGVTYTGFTERGTYRVVMYAEDSDGLEARPVAMQVQTGWRAFLPMLLKER